MGQNKTVEHYQKLITQVGNLDQSIITESIKDIETILKGKEKGLLILKHLGQSPEKKVLKNQQEYTKLLAQFKSFLKT